jgi:glycerophosphoryl diester phosphodiesterase
MTSDGVIVAMHDTTPNRTTDALGAPAVSELSWEELRELDAGSWFHPAFAGTRIPQLDEVLDLVEAEGGMMLFDVKDANLVGPLVERLEQRGLHSRSLLSAHSLSVLEAATDADPTLPLLYYIPELASAQALDLPGLAYLRVPKSVVDAPDSVDIINEAGYGAATGEFRVDYSYAIGIVDDMDAVWERVRGKVPEGCL